MPRPRCPAPARPRRRLFRRPVLRLRPALQAWVILLRRVPRRRPFRLSLSPRRRIPARQHSRQRLSRQSRRRPSPVRRARSPLFSPIRLLCLAPPLLRIHPVQARKRGRNPPRRQRQPRRIRQTKNSAWAGMQGCVASCTARRAACIPATDRSGAACAQRESSPAHARGRTSSSPRAQCPCRSRSAVRCHSGAGPDTTRRRRAADCAGQSAG